MMLEIQFLAWTSNFRSLNIEKTMIYDVGNPVPGLGQAQNVGGINQYYAFTIFHLFFFSNHDAI